MKILIINHNSGSLHHGPNLRTYYAAKELVKIGHKVTIASSSFSHKYSALPSLNGDITSEVIDFIDYCWIKCIHYKNLLQRIFSHFQFGYKLIKNLDKICIRTDVVLFSGPPPEIFLFSYLVAFKLRAPIVSDIRDLWPRTQIEMNSLQWFNPFTYFLFFCQYLIARFSDRIVSPLPGIDRYMRSVGAKNKATIIENGFDTTRNKLNSKINITVNGCGTNHSFTTGDRILLKELRSNYKLVIGYVGAFDRDNDIDSYLSAAECLKDVPEVLFLMVGGGIRSTGIVERSISLPNLVVGERVSSNDVPSVLFNMDILFCGLKPKNIYNYGVSLAKSYEYMAAAKPIIWMVQACNNPVAESGCGWTIQPENVNHLVKTIQDVLQMSIADLEKLGRLGRRYLEKEHSYNVLGKRWENLFQETIAERSK